MVFKKRKGQMSFLAIASILIIVVFLAYYSSQQTSIEKAISSKTELAQDISDEMKILQSTGESILVDAVNEITFEMGKHGGFTAENVPQRNHFGKPYFFFKGKIINIPSVEVMQQMMAEKVAQTVDDKMNSVMKNLHSADFSYSYPTVSITLFDEEILAVMKMPFEIKQDDKVSFQELEFRQRIPLRLKSMRDLAEKYVTEYAQVRRMESSILNGIINDDRIPNPPGSISQTVSCEEKTVYKYYKELISPFRENTQLSVAIELMRIQQSDLNTNNFEWSNELNTQEVEFSLLANEGEGGFESKDTIYFVPIPFGMFDMRDGAESVCISKFFVTYTVFFPVKYEITDLMETTKTVGADTDSLITALTFDFYMMPLLIGEEIFSTDNTITDPVSIEDLCTGSCTVDLSIKNSESGKIYIDSCQYDYKGGSFHKKNTVCKMHYLVVESSKPSGLSRFVEKVNIVPEFSKEIELKTFASVKGTITMKNNVLCLNSQTIKDKGSTSLNYVKGDPPAYISVYFQPLNSKMPLKKVTGDENGKYELDDIVPGKYLVLATPSYDDAGIPQHKVEATGFLINIDSGQNTIDVSMEPLSIKNIKGKYYRFAKTEEC